jgi:hypothetical protein
MEGLIAAASEVTPARVATSLPTLIQPAIGSGVPGVPDTKRSSSNQFSRCLVEFLPVISYARDQVAGLLPVETIFLCEVTNFNALRRRGRGRAHRLYFCHRAWGPPVALKKLPLGRQGAYPRWTQAGLLLSDKR